MMTFDKLTMERNNQWRLTMVQLSSSAALAEGVDNELVPADVQQSDLMLLKSASIAACKELGLVRWRNDDRAVRVRGFRVSEQV